MQKVEPDPQNLYENATDTRSHHRLFGFGGGLYEVRTSLAAEQYRVLFYLEGDALVLVHGESRRGTMVLVHGIHKKTQKTPAAVIALARKRMKEGT